MDKAMDLLPPTSQMNWGGGGGGGGQLLKRYNFTIIAPTCFSF